MRHRLEILEKLVEHIAQALSQTPDNHPRRPLLLTCLGMTHSQLYELLHQPRDIYQAIEYKTIALTVTPDDSPNMPDLLCSLAESHRRRFLNLNEPDGIEKAIEYASLALFLIPDGHPSLPYRLGDLGLLYSDRFQHLGELNDVEKAVENGSHAITLVPDGHPLLSCWLGNLGIFLNDRFERVGDLNDLEKAIQHEYRAMKVTPNTDPGLSHLASNLVRFLTNRFERLGEPEDLNTAIEIGSRALMLTSGGNPDLVPLLAHLGGCHSERYRRLGDTDDIVKAINYQSRALALTPNRHRHLPNLLTNLALSYISRFYQLGDLSDLEKAIEDQSHALTLAHTKHPHFPRWLAQLGDFYNSRFDYLGEMHDLEKGIEHQYRSLSLLSNVHPGLAHLLSNLGLSHYRRLNRLGQSNDIGKAIEYASRGVTLTPNGHPELSYRQYLLALFYCTRFEWLADLVDLDKAIEYGLRALALIHDDHCDLPVQTNNMGRYHLLRFHRLGELDDLNKAIKYRSRALDLTPYEHPSFPLVCSAYGHTSFLQYQLTGNHSHLQEALSSYRKATKSPTGRPRDKLRYAMQWATLAVDLECGALNCLEAYQTAIDNLPHFIWLGATTSQRYEDLLTTGTLAVSSAASAIQSSNYLLALEWLEHARCVVWNQSLMLRSPIDQLESLHPELGARLKIVANQLDRAGSETHESRTLSPDSMHAERIARQHRRLAKEYNELLAQARTLPGFEDFIQPSKASALVRAARYGPVVVINCHKDRCDALVILPEGGTVRHIPLQNFTAEKARRARSSLGMSLRSHQSKERGVIRRPLLEPRQNNDFGKMLTALWYDIVKPILDYLGYIKDVSGVTLPHITWCPTGVLSFLPLHAAGDYDLPHARIFNYVISSYTPTVTALLEFAPGSLSEDPRVLAIGQATTPGHSSLPGTAKELAAVKAQIQSKDRYSQFVDNKAITAAVLDAMEQHDWVHLACHAHQNITDATKSGFFLHDGTLDLAAINRRSFKKKGLAYLSACQTATGDEKLPDEAIHLASGMLMAGYTSVIATMWSVVDADAPLVADRVYSQLMKDRKLGNGEAGRALHYAVAELRRTVREQEFERWVPYIHIGS